MLGQVSSDYLATARRRPPVRAGQCGSQGGPLVFLWCWRVVRCPEECSPRYPDNHPPTNLPVNPLNPIVIHLRAATAHLTDKRAPTCDLESLPCTAPAISPSPASADLELCGASDPSAVARLLVSMIRCRHSFVSLVAKLQLLRSALSRLFLPNHMSTSWRKGRLPP